MPSEKHQREQAHAAVDPLWKSGELRHSDVYRMLKAEFGGEVHIGASDEIRCLQIIDFAKRQLSGITEKETTR